MSVLQMLSCRGLFSRPSSLPSEIDSLNRFRFHVSHAESTGVITPGFASRLRLKADWAEARLKARPQPAKFPCRKTTLELWINQEGTL